MLETSLARAPIRPAPEAVLDSALRAWEPLLESLPLGVCICDRTGAIVRHNGRAAELWGRAPKTDLLETFYCGGARAFRMDGEPLAGRDSAVGEVLHTGLSARNRETILERPDRSRIYVLSNAEPLFDNGGALVGVVNCFQDISDRKQAEARLVEQERRHRDLLDALPAAIYTTDPDGRITYYNQAAVEFSGRQPTVGVDSWCVTWKLYAPDGSPMRHDGCPMAVALKENRPVRGAEAVAERPDGTRAPFIPFPTPLQDADGRLLGGVNMLVDISERKQAESRQKVLLDELNHRVKNTLASVQSLAAHSFRGEQAPREMREAFEARLVALSSVHNLIAEGRWVDANLHSIVHDTLACYAGQIYIPSDAPVVDATAQLAVPMGMILHELTANAARYGALSTPAGRVTVCWTIETGEAGRSLILDWIETGGPEVPTPRRFGFGVQFITGAVERELGGQVDLAFAAEGLRCRIKAPL